MKTKSQKKPKKKKIKRSDLVPVSYELNPYSHLLKCDDRDRWVIVQFGGKLIYNRASKDFEPPPLESLINEEHINNTILTFKEALDAINEGIGVNVRTKGKRG